MSGNARLEQIGIDMHFSAWNRFSFRKTVHLPIVALLTIIAVAGCAAAPGEVGDSPTNGSEVNADFDATLHEMLPKAIQDSKVLRFGALWETPPMIGVDPKDTSNPVGIAPDLAEAMGQVLGVDVQWTNMQWPGQLPGLQAGSVDALMGQVSITAEREKGHVDLVSFYRSTLSLVVPAGNPKSLANVAGACGLTVGAAIGSTMSQVVTANSEKACTSQGQPAITLAEYPGAANAVSALKSGTIDAWMDSTHNQLAIAKAAPDSFNTVLIPEDEYISIDGGLLGIAVSKQTPGISEALNGALLKLAADGKYKSILDEYGLDSDAVATEDLTINPLTGTAVGKSGS